MNIAEKEAAYAVGFEKGRDAAARQELSADWRTLLTTWMKGEYPKCADLDLVGEIVALDKERLANPPDTTKFPETRGWPDLVREERRGFLEGGACSEVAMAFYYNKGYFGSRRLNTRYAGSSPKVANSDHCTAVYIRDSQEGGALFGRNLDDVRRPAHIEGPTITLPDGPDPSRPDQYADASSFFTSSVFAKKYNRWVLTSAVSGSVIGDEEPEEIFPVDVWQIMPGDCRTVKDYMEFLARYKDFWGPNNGIIVDEQGDSLAYEKSNCRVGVRMATEGVSAVTACAYVIPEMKAFKTAAGQRVLSDDAPDWEYWRGCRVRYERLLTLADEANRRGASLEDLVNIMTDHAVPFPDRICLAGETHIGEPLSGNWTLRSSSTVLNGPNRRTLFWRVEGTAPCYANLPYFIAGPGTDVRPEWTENTRTIEVVDTPELAGARA